MTEIKLHPYSAPGISQFEEKIIIDKVCRFYNVDFEKLKEKTRKSEIVLPRQICAYLLKFNAKMTLEKIGFIFNQDHSNISHACKVIENYLDTDKNFKKKFDELKSLF